MGIFDTLFGKIKTGSQYRQGGHVPLDRDPSFRGALEKLRKFRFGGDAGQNLSAGDADTIADLIEPHLKHLPPGGKLSLATKQSIRGRLWQMVKSGQLSQMDFDDAKDILEEF